MHLIFPTQDLPIHKIKQGLGMALGWGCYVTFGWQSQGIGSVNPHGGEDGLEIAKALKVSMTNH